MKYPLLMKKNTQARNAQAIGQGYKFEIEKPKNILFGKKLVFFSLLKIKFLSFFIVLMC